MTIPKLIYSLCLIFFVACSHQESAQKTVKDENIKAKSADIKEEHNENEVNLTEEQVKTAKIKIGTLTQQKLSQSIAVRGKLDLPPQNVATVAFALKGFIQKVLVLSGQKVKKGTILATITHPDFIVLQQNYLDAKSQLAFLEADFKRQKQLQAEQINSTKSFEKAQSDYLSALARLNSLKAQVEMVGISLKSLEMGTIQKTLNIRSPLSGYVADVMTNVGAFVEPQNVLFKVVDTEHLHVELTLLESDIPKVTIGQNVRFKLPQENKERRAKVYLMGREIGPDRSIQIHCHLNQEDPSLVAGMWVNAQIETEFSNAWSIENQSIIEFSGKNYIFVQEDQFSFILKEVEIGKKGPGFTEILNFFEFKSAKIVTQGAYSLLAKLKNSEEEGGHAH